MYKDVRKHSEHGGGGAENLGCGGEERESTVTAIKRGPHTSKLKSRLDSFPCLMPSTEQMFLPFPKKD